MPEQTVTRPETEESESGAHGTARAGFREPIAALPAPQDDGGGARSSGGGAAANAPAQRSGAFGSRMRKVLLVLLLIAAVGGAIWKIRKNRAETAATPVGRPAGGGGPIPVLVTAVQQRTVPIYLTALGTVTAYNSVTIKSRVDGQLLSVNVREGQNVSKGQLLAEIDPRPYQAAVAQAQGQLAKDQANAANAAAEAGRYTALYSAGVISKESQQAQISNAGQANGSIEADQAAIQAAKVNVAYTRIVSPIQGVAGLRTVDPGNIVHASDTTGLILVTQIQPISVIFTLPEDQLPQVLKLVRGGAKLAVEAYDRSETQRLATGTLLTVDNEIDTTTGTARVKAVFPNADNALFPNQFVNVRLILQQRQNAIVVPSAALQTASNGNFVYVVRKGNPPPDQSDSAAANSGTGAKTPKSGGNATGGGVPGGGDAAPTGPSFYVEALPVKIDLTQGSNVILAGGVNAGDQIVIDGQEKLKNGARVRPTLVDAPAAGAGSRGIGASPGSTGAGGGRPAPGDGTGTRRNAGAVQNGVQSGRQP